MGWTSDRLSTPTGQAAFATFAYKPEQVPLTFIGSLKWSTAEERLAFPFGVNWTMGRGLVLQTIYDGNYTHFILGTTLRDQHIGIVLARSKSLGISYGINF